MADAALAEEVPSRVEAKPDDSTSKALLSRWDQLYGEEKKMLGQRSQEMGRATDAAIQAGRQNTATGQEALQTMKGQMQSPPRPPGPAMQQQLQQYAVHWLSVAASLGALAGAFTRNHVTNSMSAFSGAVKGFAEGNVQRFDQGLRTWEQQAKAAQQTNERAIEEYKLTMESSKMSLDQKMNEVQLIASKWQDQMMASAAAQKNFTMVAQILQQRESNALQFEKLNQSIMTQTQKFEADMAKNGLVRDEKTGKIEIDMSSESPLAVRAKAIANYELPPPSGGTGRGAWLNNALMAAVLKENPQYSAKNYQTQQRTQNAFATGRQGDQVRALNVAINHLGTAEQLASALANRDIRAFNVANQQWAQETGSPAPTNFDTARSIIGKEVVKSVISGGGGVTERQQAEQMISRANSPQQLAGAITTIKRLMAGQMQGLQRQFESGTKTPGDFGSRIAPETQRELGGDQGGGVRRYNPETGRIE